jgi:hypothetical protein
VEIGVWKGQVSQYILQRNPGKLHLIDPWTAHLRRFSQSQFDTIFEGVRTLFEGDDRVVIHRASSEDVVFPPESLDWVFISGDPSSKGVYSDLNIYFRALKPGGILCGPYTSGLHSLEQGPKGGVDLFVREESLKLDIIDTSGHWQVDPEGPLSINPPTCFAIKKEI